MASDKLNLSRYHNSQIRYEGDNVVVVHESDELTLFEGRPSFRFYETLGHNPGCLTMVMDKFIFTGDAFIPGVGVTCQVPYANKKQAHESLERIKRLAEGKVVLPGHEINSRTSLLR